LMAGYSAIKILAPAFYALKDARTPMLISLLSIAINFAMNWSLVGLLQERGLALSTSVVALLNFALLYFIMQKRIQGIEGSKTAGAIAKILLASAVMAAACWAVSQGVYHFVGDHRVARLINVVASVSAGAGVFYLVAYWLGVEELKSAVGAIGGRFKRLVRR
jgi:putative peptidoglycan lipid II flippase